MRIESARALKAEVLSEVLQGGEAAAATSGGLSLGIAPSVKPGDFKLAIRTRGEAGTHGRVMNAIDKRAAKETDIRVLASAHVSQLLPAVNPAPELKPGVGVAHSRGHAGTLGFFARRVADSGVGFVSCNHVLAAEDRGAEGDAIVRAFTRRPSCSEYVVGYLDGGYERLNESEVRVDCAFALLANDVQYNPSFVGSGSVPTTHVAMPWEANYVEKVGFRTGRTRGRVSAFDLDGVEINYSFGSVLLNQQIEIEATGEQLFSGPGDSGSLVFADDYRPLGIICASSRLGGRMNGGLTYVNPIGFVLNALGVELLVG